MKVSYRICWVGTGAVIAATVLFGANLAGAVLIANVGRVAGLVNAMREPSEPPSAAPSAAPVHPAPQPAAASSLLPAGI